MLTVQRSDTIWEIPSVVEPLRYLFPATLCCRCLKDIYVIERYQSCSRNMLIRYILSIFHLVFWLKSLPCLFVTHKTCIVRYWNYSSAAVRSCFPCLNPLNYKIYSGPSINTFTYSRVRTWHIALAVSRIILCTEVFPILKQCVRATCDSPV